MMEEVGVHDLSNQMTLINRCLKKLRFQSSKYFLKRWKVPLSMTLTFLLVHVTAVTLFGDENLYLEHSNRWRRFPDSKLSPPNWVGSPQIHRSREESKVEGAPSSSRRRNTCVKGHIQGMMSVCRDQLCLRRLDDFHGYPRPKKSLETLVDSSSLEKLQLASIHRHLLSIQGTLDSINYPLLSLLVDSQKHFGTLGSVGLIQTRLDTFSSFLASSVSKDQGEKLVVVNSFNNSMRPLAFYSAHKNTYQMPTDKDVYTEHLFDLGYSKTVGERTSREFHLIDDSTTLLPKTNLSDFDVPQFRIISLSSDWLDPVSLISGLESAACNLRDGGLVILNFDGEERHPLQSLKSILENKFGTALSVVVATHSKIFIASTNWKSRYVDLILENSKSLRSGLVTFDVATGYYGKN